MKEEGVHLSKGTLIFIIFVSALLLRISYMLSLEIEVPISFDAYNYFMLAYNLVVNGTYSLSPVAPFVSTTYVTPGYPLFLASFFSLTQDMDFFYWGVLGVQALLSSLTAVIAFYLASRFTNRWFAFFAGMCVAFSPHLTVFSAYVLTETLFTFLLLIAVLALTKAVEKRALGFYLMAGGLFAAATLVRPALMLFPFVIFLVMVKLYGAKASGKAIIFFLLGFILLLSPWHIWKNQHPVKNEVNLLPAAIALGGYPDLIYKNPDFRGFPYREDPEHDEMVKSSEYAVSIIWERAKNEPVKYLKWYILGKLTTFWQPEIIAGQGGVFVYPVKHSLYDKASVAKFSLITFFALQPILVYLALLYSIFLLGYQLRVHKTNEREDVHFVLYILAGGVLYFTVIHMILAPLPRYATPLYPFIFIISAAAFFKLKALLVEKFRAIN